MLIATPWFWEGDNIYTHPENHFTNSQEPMWPIVPWGKASSRRHGIFPLVLLWLFLSGTSPPKKGNDPSVRVKKCSAWPCDCGRLMKLAGTLWRSIQLNLPTEVRSPLSTHPSMAWGWGWGGWIRFLSHRSRTRSHDWFNGLTDR